MNKKRRLIINLSIVAMAIAIVLIGAGIYVFRNQIIPNAYNYQPVNELTHIQNQTTSNYSNFNNGRAYSPPNCVGKGVINFTAAPRKLEDIEMIMPLGMMSSGHITPTDHQYYYTHGWKLNPTAEDLRDVIAPADGVITQVQRMPSWTVYSKQGLEDYRIQIYHTCTFYTIYIHLLKLSDRIKNAAGNLSESRNIEVNIPVKAGEVLGSAISLDFSVHNDDVTLKGFVVPEHYSGEPWKIHTVDPYNYFGEPLRSELIAKTERTAQPFGGKIDYDIDGKIVGNWFVENSGGYSGVIIGQYNSWSNHIAITYDAIDSSHLIFSTGTFTTKGEGKQFGIKGNSPDPGTLDKNSGVIKLELVNYDYKSDGGTYWDKISYASNLKALNHDDQVKGVVLLQLIEDRKLKLEIFPDKIASDISGFVNPIMYER